jgi:hypothetical protein
MTAQTETQRSSSGCLVALLVVAGAIALIAVPALNLHAKQRHGAHAVSALKYVNRHTPEPDDDETLWTGTDSNGRTYYVVRLRQLVGKPTTWAVVIVVGGVLVTAFLAQSSRSVERIKERCE